MATECADTKKNIGKTKCTKVPQSFKAMIETPNGFSLTEANLASASALKTAIQAAIKASVDIRIYKWPKFSRMESNSEETKYVESPLGTRKSRDGNYRFRHFVSAGLCTHKAMYSHSSTEGRLIYIDLEDNWLVTKDSSLNYRGMSFDLLNVEKLKLSSGDDLTESPIYASLANNKELDQSGYLFNFPGLFDEIEPLTDVTLTVTAQIATQITVSVVNACDGSPISGLVTADFAVTTTAGAAQALTGVTEPNDDGVYLLAKAAFVDGFVNLVAPSALTLTAYESTGKKAVDIP